MADKKFGRPTSNPKTNQLRIRLSDDEVRKLDECCKTLDLNKSEIVLLGIDKVYQEIKNKTLLPDQS